MAGIAAGFTIGLLFAPSRGRDNREKLGATLLNLGETLVDTAVVQFDNLFTFTDNLISQFKPQTDPYAKSYDEIEHAII